MALERRLLEFAETAPRELDAVLLDLLQRSDSAALDCSRSECSNRISTCVWGDALSATTIAHVHLA